MDTPGRWAGARCQHWSGRTRCEKPAEFLMFDPDGRPVPGGAGCAEHTWEPIDEYLEKLGEVWTAQPIPGARPAGRD